MLAVPNNTGRHRALSNGRRIVVSRRAAAAGYADDGITFPDAAYHGAGHRLYLTGARSSGYRRPYCYRVDMCQGRWRSRRARRTLARQARYTGRQWPFLVSPILIFRP